MQSSVVGAKTRAGAKKKKDITGAGDDLQAGPARKPSGGGGGQKPKDTLHLPEYAHTMKAVTVFLNTLLL